MGKGIKSTLDIVASNYEYSSSGFTLHQTESNFPEISNTLDKFLEKLISEKYINKSQINTTWQPSLKQEIQICGIKVVGCLLYIKLVEGKVTTRQEHYTQVQSIYPKYTVVVIHFLEEDPLIELRCSLSQKKYYGDYIMKIMGFAEPYKSFPVPKLTKDIVKAMYGLLSAGVASRHIAIPLGVASVKFNGKKGINLIEDTGLKAMMEKIKELDVPTDDILDDTLFFKYSDEEYKIDIETTIEIDIKNSYFKFSSKVPNFVINHVKEGLWAAIIKSEKGKKDTSLLLSEAELEVATTTERKKDVVIDLEVINGDK